MQDTLANLLDRFQRPLFLLAAFCLAIGLFGPPALAQSDTPLGTFTDWRAHSYVENGKVCNMWSRPTKHEEQGRPRGEIYAFVTHRPGINTRAEVSFQMGYTVDPSKPITITIGSRKFEGYSEDGRQAVFVAQDVAENGLINAMRRGARMTVQAVSQRGTPTKDTYSLSGFTAALRAIDAAC